MSGSVLGDFWYWLQRDILVAWQRGRCGEKENELSRGVSFVFFVHYIIILLSSLFEVVTLHRL